ncbi:hypothetical protein [Faecalibacterium prausnitzii]|uniref:hypothetical protein n=1 Tax=Faecalibacterium prausnitzii TaxID=853 RepID=UPI0018CC0059|nr:hypothetical protein [Faecalibacterium prausnitzii]
MAQYLVQTAYEEFKVQLPKRKIPPCKTGEKFCRVKRRQNESGVLQGDKIFMGNKSSPFCTFLQIWWDLR